MKPFPWGDSGNEEFSSSNISGSILMNNQNKQLDELMSTAKRQGHSSKGRISCTERRKSLGIGLST